MSITQAEQLFRAYFDFEPRKNDIVRVGMRSASDALVIGNLDGIIYRSLAGGKPFIHRFKASDRPLLTVSFDGRQIYVLKGAYRFTERGFIG